MFSEPEGVISTEDIVVCRSSVHTPQQFVAQFPECAYTVCRTVGRLPCICQFDQHLRRLYNGFLSLSQPAPSSWCPRPTRSSSRTTKASRRGQGGQATEEQTAAGASAAAHTRISTIQEEENEAAEQINAETRGGGHREDSEGREDVDTENEHGKKLSRHLQAAPSTSSKCSTSLLHEEAQNEETSSDLFKPQRPEGQRREVEQQQELQQQQQQQTERRTQQPLQQHLCEWRQQGQQDQRLHSQPQQRTQQQHEKQLIANSDAYPPPPVLRAATLRLLSVLLKASLSSAAAVAAANSCPATVPPPAQSTSSHEAVATQTATEAAPAPALVFQENAVAGAQQIKGEEQAMAATAQAAATGLDSRFLGDHEMPASSHREGLRAAHAAALTSSSHATAAAAFDREVSPAAAAEPAFGQSDVDEKAALANSLSSAEEDRNRENQVFTLVSSAATVANVPSRVGRHQLKKVTVEQQGGRQLLQITERKKQWLQDERGIKLSSEPATTQPYKQQQQQQRLEDQQLQQVRNTHATHKQQQSTQKQSKRHEEKRQQQQRQRQLLEVEEQQQGRLPQEEKNLAAPQQHQQFKQQQRHRTAYRSSEEQQLDLWHLQREPHALEQQQQQEVSSYAPAAAAAALTNGDLLRERNTSSATSLRTPVAAAMHATARRQSHLPCDFRFAVVMLAAPSSSSNKTHAGCHDSSTAPHSLHGHTNSRDCSNTRDSSCSARNSSSSSSRDSSGNKRDHRDRCTQSRIHNSSIRSSSSRSRQIASSRNSTNSSLSNKENRGSDIRESHSSDSSTCSSGDDLNNWNSTSTINNDEALPCAAAAAPCSGERFDVLAAVVAVGSHAASAAARPRSPAAAFHSTYSLDTTSLPAAPHLPPPTCRSATGSAACPAAAASPVGAAAPPRASVAAAAAGVRSSRTVEGTAVPRPDALWAVFRVMLPDATVAQAAAAREEETEAAAAAPSTSARAAAAAAVVEDTAAAAATVETAAAAARTASALKSPGKEIQTIVEEKREQEGIHRGDVSCRSSGLCSEQRSRGRPVLLLAYVERLLSSFSPVPQKQQQQQGLREQQPQLENEAEEGKEVKRLEPVKQTPASGQPRQQHMQQLLQHGCRQRLEQQKEQESESLLSRPAGTGLLAAAEAPPDERRESAEERPAAGGAAAVAAAMEGITAQAIRAETIKGKAVAECTALSSGCTRTRTADREGCLVVALLHEGRRNPAVKNSSWLLEKQQLLQQATRLVAATATAATVTTGGEASEGKERGQHVEEVLLTTAEGCILEGLSSNFFAYNSRREVLATADSSCCLSGTIRGTVLSLCQEKGVPVELEPPSFFTQQQQQQQQQRQLPEWTAAFISSTSRLVLPIKRLLFFRREDAAAQKATANQHAHLDRSRKHSHQEQQQQQQRQQQVQEQRQRQRQQKGQQQKQQQLQQQQEHQLQQQHEQQLEQQEQQQNEEVLVDKGRKGDKQEGSSQHQKQACLWRKKRKHQQQEEEGEGRIKERRQLRDDDRSRDGEGECHSKTEKSGRIEVMSATRYKGASERFNTQATRMQPTHETRSSLVKDIIKGSVEYGIQVEDVEKNVQEEITCCREKKETTKRVAQKEKEEPGWREDEEEKISRTKDDDNNTVSDYWIDESTRKEEWQDPIKIKHAETRFVDIQVTEEEEKKEECARKAASVVSEYAVSEYIFDCSRDSLAAKMASWVTHKAVAEATWLPL